MSGSSWTNSPQKKKSSCRGRGSSFNRRILYSSKRNNIQKSRARETRAGQKGEDFSKQHPASSAELMTLASMLLVAVAHEGFLLTQPTAVPAVGALRFHTPVMQASGTHSRRNLISAAALGVMISYGPSQANAASAIDINVIKSGKEGSGNPTVGDLVAIRFKCVLQKSGAVIDNILENPEPYYFRLGGGQVLPGVEQTLPKMKAGDVWALTIPPELGFGAKGRSASPGKPRIPGDAILDFTLELVAVPGKDLEIIEENGLVD